MNEIEIKEQFWEDVETNGLLDVITVKEHTEKDELRDALIDGVFKVFNKSPSFIETINLLKLISKYINDINKINLKVLSDKLDEIIAKDNYDEEKNHIDADEALLNYIDNEKIRNKFDSINKWYA